MKTYEALNLLARLSREVKMKLRDVGVTLISLQCSYTTAAEDLNIKALNISHNELAGIRFKLAQAASLVEQSHAVLAECDLELIEITKKAHAPLDPTDTDLMMI